VRIQCLAWPFGLLLSLGGIGYLSVGSCAEPAPQGAKEAPAALKDSSGDPLPQGAIARVGTLRFRHPHGLFALAVSPDGKTLAAGPYNAAPVRLWDFASGKELARLPARVWTRSPITFSPDSKSLATVEGDTIRVWEVSSGKEIGSIKLGRGPNDWTAVFSPDGKTLLSAGGDEHIWMWDVATGEPRGKLSEHKARVEALAFSADGKQLLSASSGGPNGNGELCLWEWPGGKPVHTLLSGGWGFFPARTPDGKTVVSANRQSTIRLCDAATGKERLQLPGQADNVTHAAFTPDGTTLLSTAGDGTARFWDVATGKVLHTIRVNQRHVSFTAALTPDGKVFLTARNDGLVQKWDVATGKELDARPAAAPVFALLERFRGWRSVWVTARRASEEGGPASLARRASIAATPSSKAL
jgi:WD40 repeat protein